MLLKVINRLNSDLMERCSKICLIINKVDGIDRDDKTIQHIMDRHNEGTQQMTFEIDTILNIVKEKLKPLSEVENEFWKIEEYYN